MKKKITLLCIIVFIILLIVDQQNQYVHSNGSGAPIGNTGSPFDNKTCARSGCHSGSATFVPGIITSNIPPSGYIPGATYTITTTCSQAGINKWGFQVSPMNASGTLLGTMVITNVSTTKLVGGSKYITHTTAGTTGTGTKTWSFNWIAPLTGNGSVTFYGAFNYANGNNGASGDIIKTSNLTVTENTTGIAENMVKNIKLAISPNPILDKMILHYEIENNGQVILSLVDNSGKTVRFQDLGNKNRGNYTEEISGLSNLVPGVYFVNLVCGDKNQLVKKVIKL